MSGMPAAPSKVKMGSLANRNAALGTIIQFSIVERNIQMYHQEASSGEVRGYNAV